jgi:hypothetical protein
MAAANVLIVSGAELRVRPRARGFGMRWGGTGADGVHELSLVVDSGGVIGMRLSLGNEATPVRIEPGLLRHKQLPGIIEAVAAVLESAEAVGRVAWSFWIASAPSSKLATGEGSRPPPSRFYASRELATPSTQAERTALAGEVIREYVREAGASEFES